MRVALRMDLLFFFRFCHRMKGLWNGFSLSIQHTGLQKPSGGVSTSGLLLGPIVNVTALRLHLFRVCFVVVASVT